MYTPLSSSSTHLFGHTFHYLPIVRSAVVYWECKFQVSDFESSGRYLRKELMDHAANAFLMFWEPPCAFHKLCFEDCFKKKSNLFFRCCIIHVLLGFSFSVFALGLKSSRGASFGHGFSPSLVSCLTDVVKQLLGPQGLLPDLGSVSLFTFPDRGSGRQLSRWVLVKSHRRSWDPGPLWHYRQFGFEVRAVWVATGRVLQEVTRYMVVLAPSLAWVLGFKVWVSTVHMFKYIRH